MENKTTIRELIANGTISLDTVVLGELPITKDKVIVGMGATVYHKNHHNSPGEVADQAEFHLRGYKADWHEYELISSCSSVPID